MSSAKKGLAGRIFLMLIGIAVVLLCLHLLMQHLNISHNEKHGQIFEVSNRLDFDDEASIPTWFSQAIWLGVAFAGALAGSLSKTKPVRRVWFMMAALGLLFSLDEVAGLHELSLQSLHLLFFGLAQPSSTLNAWWLLMPVILVGGGLFLKKLYQVLHFQQWLIIMMGFGLFFLGAVGLDLFGIEAKSITFLYQGIIVGIEESLELLGSITILYVVMNYLESVHRPELVKIWSIARAQK